MNKRFSAILFCAIVIIAVCIYFVVGNYYINDSKMKTFVNESESKTSYVYFDNLYCKDIRLDLKEVVKHEENSVIQQAFCIKDNYVYFSYQYVKDSIVHWCLASISVDGTEYKLIFDEIFDRESLHKYELKVGEVLSQRNGYFYDNKIIVTDFSKLVEYNMEKDLVTIYNYDEYEINENEVAWNIDDFNEITLKKNNKIVVINKSELSKKSSVANKVLSSYDRMVWHDLSSTQYFFNDVQVINDEIYIICSLLNRHGETYTLIFECDIENEEYNYCSYHFTKDVTRHFYVVPTVDQSK